MTFLPLSLLPVRKLQKNTRDRKKQKRIQLAPNKQKNNKIHITNCVYNSTQVVVVVAKSLVDSRKEHTICYCRVFVYIIQQRNCEIFMINYRSCAINKSMPSPKKAPYSNGFVVSLTLLFRSISQNMNNNKKQLKMKVWRTCELTNSRFNAHRVPCLQCVLPVRCLNILS